MAPKSRKARSIPAPQPAADRKLRFSFEFYDSVGTKYCLSQGVSEQIRAVLLRLKEVNENTFNQLRQKGTVYHFHPVDWSKTTEKAGFPDARLNDLEPFQFALLGVNNQKARVYDAVQGDTFYIVWFDWDHAIWPSLKKHT